MSAQTQYRHDSRERVVYALGEPTCRPDYGRGRKRGPGTRPVAWEVSRFVMGMSAATGEVSQRPQRRYSAKIDPAERALGLFRLHDGAFGEEISRVEYEQLREVYGAEYQKRLHGE